MRVEDFPRPKNDNRRGVHWSASVYHPSGSGLDFWISELQTMHVKWVKLLDDGGGSSLELCQRLLAADVMPIVRLYRPEPNPGHIGGREEDTILRMIAAGVRYFETNNEPDLPVEWQGGQMPHNWLEISIENFIIDADKIIAMGGLPALPAMGVDSKDNPVAMVVQKGRADLFEKGAWIAIHSYTLNHPLGYPYDAVNQEGTPVNKEEYDRLGSWAWEGQPRDLINSWRTSDKNPGATLADDSNCFLAFHLMDQLASQILGYKVPIISTEGGPVVGWRDDRRYPRITPEMHADWVTTIYGFMQGDGEVHGIRCPNNYFATCPWLLANYRLGYLAPGWESQAWYTDWWNGEFKLSGELPVVAAVKAMPNLPVDLSKGNVVAGRLVQADTDAPVPDLQAKLMSGEQEVAVCTSAADGTFRFERLLPGSYDLVVVPWGVVRRGIVPTPEPVQQLIIRLVGGSKSVLSGQVLDQTGAPKTGTSVTLRRDDTLAAEMTSLADGSFRFDGLMLGSYQLSIPGIAVAGIALDGWQAKAIKLTTGTPLSYRYTVTTQRLLPEAETAGRRIFYGTVSDTSGKPINDIKIQMSWHNAEPGAEFPVKPTGHDPYRPVGTYEFVHTPGLFRLQVVQGDWPSDAADSLETAHVSGREGQPIAYEVNFQLQSAGTQARIDGAMLGARPGTKLTLVGTNLRRETALARDNSFAFTALAPGSYQLEMAGIGVIVSDIRLETGGLFKLIFPLRSRLSGQVLSAPEGLLAVLHAPSAWGWTRQVPLDPAGKFSFEGLPPGRYWLEVGPEVLSDLRLTGENSLQIAPIDLTLSPQSVVRGRVADGVGQPQAEIQMVLRRVEDPGHGDGLVVAQTRTSADGAYRFSNLLAGRYSLEAVGMGLAASNIVLDGQHDATFDLLWNPPFPLGIILGRVLAADDTPRPGLQVQLWRDGAELARTLTDDSGTFRFAGLTPGLYTLMMTGGLPPIPGIQLDLNAVVSRDIILPAAPTKFMAHYLLFSPPPALQPVPGPRGAGDASLACVPPWPVCNAQDGQAGQATPRDLGGGAYAFETAPREAKPVEDPPHRAELAECRLTLSLALPYLHRTGFTAGFSLAEATSAAEVTIVGDRVPETSEQALRIAGCQVKRLVGDGYALAAVFEGGSPAQAPTPKGDVALAEDTSEQPALASLSPSLARVPPWPVCHGQDGRAGRAGQDGAPRGPGSESLESVPRPRATEGPSMPRDLGGDKPLGHYVLFGPSGQPSTLANLLLAQDFILAFSACFGFRPNEASSAKIVSVIADTASVSQQVGDGLQSIGTTVERVSGSVGEVGSALAARISNGRPLV